MKKFKFSLQKLLDIKNSSIELLKLEMSKLNTQIERLKEEIENITEKISKAQKRMDEGLQGVKFILEWMNYIQSLYHERKEKISELVSLENQLDELRQRYTKLYHEQKALEKLKELQKNSHDLEATREEQKIMDDIALERSMKKKKS
ncbi:flagellar export protein FliJ [Mesoaciditoga lauensis]|uniref:flagellar export protein FliJ n=1 Tax=Mesoaciditoga lauensis TaxID=1495039 RepID=UPI0006918541|nr:flagellar export protein FliJ [Mesoaciditoga lauensis]